MNPKLEVLVVGASGHLGSELTKELLSRQGLHVNILIRDRSHCPELADAVELYNGRVIIGDITKPSTIRGATKGIHTVICAVEGDEKTIFDGQMNLLEDCVANGVKRFVPSDFTIDYTKVDSDIHPFIALKKRFREELKKRNIGGLFIFCGMNMETFFERQAQPLDFWEKGIHKRITGIHYWHNKTQKLPLTSYHDLARFVAAAIMDPNRTGDLRFVSEFVNVNEVSKIMSEIKKKEITPINAGSVDTLKKLVKDKMKKNKIDSAYLAYELAMFEGQGQLEHTHNHLFPEIHPITVGEWLVTHPDKIKSFAGEEEAF